MDGEDGIELIDYIKSRWSAVKILVYSSHDEETFAGRVLRAGATGFISKREPMPKIVAAVRQILCGEVYLSPQHDHPTSCSAPPWGNRWTTTPSETLSNRELQVFEMIGQGMNTVRDRPEAAR